MLILFLGAENSSLPLMSEAIFNHHAPQGFEAISASTTPCAGLHPRAAALLEQHDICIAGCFSKTWHDLPQTPDVLVTVCNSIDTDTCPLSLRPVLHAHWGDHDAADAHGTDDEIDKSFAEAYAILHTRITALLAFPHDALRERPHRLAAALSEVGLLGLPATAAVQ